MPLALADLSSVLGLAPGTQLEAALGSIFGTLPPSPEVKSYPDATYHNYYSLGVSLCFLPSPSSTPSASSASQLALDSIDIFNPPPSLPSRPNKAPTKPVYNAPPSPLVLNFADKEVVLPPRKKGEKEIRYPRPDLHVEPGTTGREMVRAMGEPSRKGAGGWVGVWLEWDPVVLVRGDERVDIGVMLELNDPKVEERTEEQKAKGMGGVWDRAAGWQWGSIKVFRPAKPKP